MIITRDKMVVNELVGYGWIVWDVTNGQFTLVDPDNVTDFGR